ncbi:hypothetical protein HYX17_00795 [Candidatus Woesearchaeota archaeon]|nr:hypothetical protein [Candidatus Woesearchaeota archaeon]
MPNLVERVKNHSLAKLLGIPLLSTFLALSPIFPIPEVKAETKRKDNPVLLVDRTDYTINNHKIISYYPTNYPVRNEEELRKAAEGFVVLNAIKKKLEIGIQINIGGYEKIINANELDNKIIKFQSELIEKSRNAFWLASIAGRLFSSSILDGEMDKSSINIGDVLKAAKSISRDAKPHYLNFATTSFNEQILERREGNKLIEDYVKANNRLNHKLASEYKSNEWAISELLSPLMNFYANSLRYEFIASEWTDDIIAPLIQKTGNYPLAEFTKLASQLIKKKALDSDPFKKLSQDIRIEVKNTKHKNEIFQKRVDEIVELNYSFIRSR